MKGAPDRFRAAGSGAGFLVAMATAAIAVTGGRAAIIGLRDVPNPIEDDASPDATTAHSVPVEGGTSPTFRSWAAANRANEYAPFLAGVKRAGQTRMRTMEKAWRALALAVGALGVGCSPGGDPSPPPFCGPTPDGGGGPCPCPGTSVCSPPQFIQFNCLKDGTWEKTDLSCVLGLHCRATAECASGQACCGDPYTGWWGTQITSSSCKPAPCSSDTLQLCQSSTECVQPGFGCGAVDLAFPADASVLTCSPHH